MKAKNTVLLNRFSLPNSSSCIALVFLALLLVVFQALPAAAKLDDDLDWQGEQNGWPGGDPDNMTYGGEVSAATNFPDYRIWETTIVCTNAANDEFKLMNWAWFNQWCATHSGNGVADAVSVNTPFPAIFDTSDPRDNMAVSGINNGWYYTYRFYDNGYDTTTMAILATSANPVTISSVASITDTTNVSPIDVTINLSAATCAQENVLLVYTVDAWDTRYVVTASQVAGSQYKATIPAFACGTKVTYYVITSTVNAATYRSYTNDIDRNLVTLAGNNNAGSNYSYVVQPPTKTYHRVYPPTGVFARYGGGPQFSIAEKVRTTGGASAYLTWDTDNIYAAFTGGTNDGDSYVILVDTNPGVASGALPTDTIAGRGYWGNTFRPDVAISLTFSTVCRQIAGTAGGWPAYTNVSASCSSYFNYDGGVGSTDTIVVGIPRSVLGILRPMDSCNFWIYAVSAPATVWANFDNQQNGKNFPWGTDSGLTLFDTTSVPAAPASPVSPGDGQTNVASRRPTIEWSAAVPGDPADSVVNYYFEIGTRPDLADSTNFPLEIGWRGSATSFTCTTTLQANIWYYWRVKAKDATGDESPFSDTWRFQISTIIAVDGNLSDWDNGERFEANNSDAWYFTWDSTYAYVAWKRDNAFETGDVIFVAIDNTSIGAGSGAPPQFGAPVSSHTLPFNADTVVWYRHRDLSAGLNHHYWSGAAWTYVAAATGGSEYKNTGQYQLEFRFPWTLIGNPTNFRVVLYVVNENNGGYLWSSLPQTNRWGTSADLAAYLQYPRVPGITPNSRPYFLSKRTWTSPAAPGPTSFSPNIDGVKDPEWGTTPSATSSMNKQPNPGEGDTTPTPMSVPSGGLARDVYVTNDAQWLYIGWQAFGDPYQIDQPTNSEQSAHYGFVITDTSSWGSPIDPWKTTSQGTRVDGYGCDVWTNLFANYGNSEFSGGNRYVSDGAGWDIGATLSSGTDYSVYLTDRGAGWGEVRIPLSSIRSDLKANDTIAIIHYARHNGYKDGVDDLTPFNGNAASNYSASAAVIPFQDTFVILYRIKQGVIDATHWPDTAPISGYRAMRTPDTPTFGDRVNLVARTRPSGVATSVNAYYSIDTGTTWTPVSLGLELQSGGADFWSAYLPSLSKESQVFYYFELQSTAMTTYLYGTDTQSTAGSSLATARSNAFALQVANRTPIAPASVAMDPVAPSDNDTITATASGAGDSDAQDTVIYRFQWYRNGIVSFTTYDVDTPFTSQVRPESTSVGDSWIVYVSAGDGVDTSSPLVGLPVVVTTLARWPGVLPSLANTAQVVTNGGITEWIWRDKSGEARQGVTNYDLKEARLQADTDYLYLFFRLGPFVLWGANIAVAIDTSLNATGGNEIGDQTNTLLDSQISSPPVRHERQIIVHSVIPNTLSVEIDTGAGVPNWGYPSSGSSVSVAPDAGVVEIKVARQDLLLKGPGTFRASIAVFANFTGLASTTNTTGSLTPSDAYDAVSVAKAGLNDTAQYATAYEEDLSDGDLDFWIQLTLSDTSILPNAAPSPTPFQVPGTGDTVLSNPPTFTWGLPTDTDAGDTVAGFLFELADSGTPLDGQVLYRTTVIGQLYSLPSMLIDSSFYTWRARPFDRTGQLGTAPSRTFFLADSTNILVSAPTDLQNNNNMGQMNGLEVASTSIRWNWVAAVHSESAPIMNYVIQIDTSTAFSPPRDSITLPSTARLYTYSGAVRGQTYYARILAVDTGGFTGYSPASDGIYVSRRQANGDTSDWGPQGTAASNDTSYSAAYSEIVWVDASGDQRPEPPNHTSLDLRNFQVTADPYNLYILATTQGFVDGYAIGQVAISYNGNSEERAFQGRSIYAQDAFTTTSASWEHIVRWRTGNDDCYLLNTNYSGQPCKYSEHTINKFVELAVPLSYFGSASDILGKTVTFTVAMFRNDNGNIGQCDTGSNNCNAADVITDQAGNTYTAEVSDQVINYCIVATFNESGLVTSFYGLRETSSYTPSLPGQSGEVLQEERDLIMYNVFIDRFYSGRSDNPPPDPNMTGGDFQGLMDSMTYFNYLGMNAIYTSPVCDFGGGAWGYNQSDLYAVQWSYADPSARWYRLQSFVELSKKARNHNIKMVIDWVPGQIYQGRTTRNHPEMFDGSKRFGGERVCEERASARQFFVDHSLSWAAIGAVGLRADNTKFYQPSDDPPNGMPFYRYMRIKWDEVYPGLYVFGEQPGGASDIGAYVYDGMRMDGQLDFPIREQINSWVGGWQTATSFINNFTGNEASYGSGVMAGFIENHDHTRTYHNMGGGGDNDGSKSGGIMARMRAGYHFCAMNSQPPILFYGDEIPLSGWKDCTYPFPPSKCGEGVGTELQGQTRPFNWSFPDGTWLRDHLSDYFTARNVFSEMRGSNGNRFIVNPSPNDAIVVYRRGNGAGDQQKVIGVVNRSGGSIGGQTISAGDADGIRYRDWCDPAAWGTTAGGNVNGAGGWTVADKGHILVRGGFGRYAINVNAGEPGVIVSVDNNPAWTQITGADGKCWIYRVMTAEFGGAGTQTRTLYWWKPGYTVHSRQFWMPAVGGDQGTLGGGETTVTLVTLDNNGPPTPTGLVAVPRDRAVWLRWETVYDFPTEDPQSHVTYRVYRSTTPNDPNPEWIMETLKPWWYDSNTDDFLTNGTTYYYRIRAADRNGNLSGWSQEVSCAPTKYTVKFYFTTEGTSYDGQSNLTLKIAGNCPELGNWSPISMTQIDSGLWVYETTMDPTLMPEYKFTVNGSWEWDNIFYSNNISYDRHGRPRLVKIVDHNGHGLTVFTNKWNVDGDVAPRRVRNVVATGGDTFIQVGWTPNDEADVNRYIIRRSTDQVNWTEIGDASITQNTFTDISAAASTTYYYQVRAVDWWNLGGNWSTTSSASLVASDVTPPNRPSNLVLYPVDTGTVRLTWSPNSDGDLAGYILYRATTPDVPITLINRVNSSVVGPSLSPSYVDTGVSTGTRYYYKLIAIDNVGNLSQPSDTKTAYLVAVTFSCDLSNVNPSSMEISGSAYSLGPSPTRVNLSNVSSTVWQKTIALFAGVQVYYRYSYNGGSGAEAAFATSSTLREYTPPEIASVTVAQDWEDAPGGITNPAGYAGNNITYLSWTADSSVDVVRYVIERASASDTTFRTIAASVSGTSYSDSGVTNNETYYYFIRSEDGGTINLQSNRSRMITVTPRPPVWIRFRVEADRPRPRVLALGGSR